MAEQTIEAGTTVNVIVNVVDSNGDHVAAVIDTTTTRLQKGNSSDTTWNSVAPTVDTISTGVYRVRFTGVSPAVTVSDNDDRVRCKINGTIAGTAWTEYHLPLRVVMANTSTELLETSANQIVSSAVETSTTAATTTTFSTLLTVDEYFEGRTLIFTSGALKRFPVKITAAALVSSELSFTVEDHGGNAMPATPSDGDTFIIV